MIKPIANTDFLVTIGGEDFDLTFHVVSGHCMDVSVVLGKPLCLLADVRITPEGLNITKFTKNDDMVMGIDLVEKPELDIDETTSENAKAMVTEMIENYKPAKTKTTNVEMVVLKDETPIYRNPRRLPLKERIIVEDHIEQRLSEDIIKSSKSEFCSPIVLTNKRDITSSLCRFQTNKQGHLKGSLPSCIN